MKKAISLIFPFVTGLFGGWFIECFLCVISVTMSPFANPDQSEFLVFCSLNSLVSALILIALIIVDISFFMDFGNKKKRMLHFIVQACTTIFVCLVSWHYAQQVIDVLYNIF